MKKILKNRVFLCILTALIFGTIGVSAATYFESSAVIYDNTESGLSSTDVQGAIDELYNTCKSLTNPTLGDQIIREAYIVTSGDGLYKDEYEVGKYLYRGVNPNNYITFNNEEAGWRIISIEKNGNVKIIKNSNIGKIAWDTSDNNNWARPATLNTYLNNTYSNSITATAQGQTIDTNWNIGYVLENNNDIQVQIENEKQTIWKGKIGLATLSEYIRANSNLRQCGNFSLYKLNYDDCYNTNWLAKTNYYWWTISSYKGNSYDIFGVVNYGQIGTYFAREDYAAVRPVVVLSSDIKITGGDGTQSNPYTIQ